MLAIAVVAVLGAWFAMTAIVQYPNAVGRRLRAYDPIGHLLPGWNFFAPKPIQGDFAVWYRSWRAADDRGDVVEASSTPWLELAGIEQRRLTDSVVNPGRYTRKSIFSCCMAIVKGMKRFGPESAAGPGLPPDAVIMSLPYLLLTEKVTDICRNSAAVQFRIDVIIYDRGDAHSHTAFRSAVHRVAGATAAR